MNNWSFCERGSFTLTSALLGSILLFGCSAQTGTTPQQESTTKSGATPTSPSVEVPPGFKKVSMLDSFSWLIPADYHAEVNETKGILDVEAPESASAAMLTIETDYSGTMKPTPASLPKVAELVSGPATVTSASGMPFDKVEYKITDIGLHCFRMTSKTEYMLATVEGTQPLPSNVRDVYEKIVLSVRKGK